MRVFDFDNTIYDGESTFDFYLFSIRYNPRVAKYIILAVYNLIKYKLGKTTIADLENAAKKYSSLYLNAFDDKEKLVSAFWDRHIKKIKPWYSPQADDVIMTASFNLMMDEFCRRFGIKSCICSTVNRDTMQVEYINFSENKPKAFGAKYPDAAPDEFYTDNMLDRPMIDISKKAFLVKGNKIKRIK